jgi:hypothetical protein
MLFMGVCLPLAGSIRRHRLSVHLQWIREPARQTDSRQNAFQKTGLMTVPARNSFQDVAVDSIMFTTTGRVISRSFERLGASYYGEEDSISKIL